jgi:hypothetical protein
MVAEGNFLSAAEKDDKMLELRGSANEWDNSPPSEALLEFLGRRYLPGAADALRAAKAEPFS